MYREHGEKHILFSQCWVRTYHLLNAYYTDRFRYSSGKAELEEIY